jgi:predicted transposase/invertase (TIGR01784 family)
MMARYDPLNDYLFYKIMGEKGDEVQLLGFLNAVLGKTGDDRFTSVEILENKTFTADCIGDKSVTLDVRAILQGKTRVNVEVQVRNYRNMEKRSLFHWSKEFSKSLKEGKDYLELPNVIAINIVNFNFPDTRNFHSCFHIREDTEPEIILTDVLEIHFLNMVKYRKLKGKNVLMDPLRRWLAWLNKNSSPELLAEVIKMDTSILTAEERLKYLAGDEDMIDIYDRRFKALCDHTSQMNYAREVGYKRGEQKGLKKGLKRGLQEGREKGFNEGHQQGHQQGHQAGRQEIVKNALAKGFSIEAIQEITGFDVETIKNLMNQVS